MSKILKILLGLALTGGIVAGAVFASANTLGGVSVGNLGADDAVVASCDSAVTVTYALDFETPSYRIDSVTVSDLLDACIGQTVRVTLDGSGAPERSAVVPDGVLDVNATLVPFEADNVTAESVTGIAINIRP